MQKAFTLGPGGQISVSGDILDYHFSNLTILEYEDFNSQIFPSQDALGKVWSADLLLVEVLITPHSFFNTH